MDKLTQVILDGLKQALARPDEQRLFKSGKLEGVFPGRAGLNAEAATQSLRDGLLEQTRTETKGKTVVEWVRVTPKGVEFLHQHESPVRAMDDLRAILQTNKEGIPAWMQDIRKELADLSQRLTDEVRAIAHRLEILTERVGEGLRRADDSSAKLNDDALAKVPWASHALAYLDKRKESGIVNHCPMPELFNALKEKQGELTVTDFHAGLRLLHDKAVVRLFPLEELNGLAQPEYALLDGPTTYYHVAR